LFRQPAPQLRLFVIIPVLRDDLSVDARNDALDYFRPHARSAHRPRHQNHAS
jgi:hypothetical protein